MLPSMNLRTEILKEHSKHNTIRLANWVGVNTKRFKELMELFLNGEYRVTQRAAWIVRHCAEKHPDGSGLRPKLIEPYLEPMLKRMMEAGVHVAVKRNVIGILQDIEIPRKLWGKVAKLCFDFLESNEPIAVRVFSMTVLANIAKHEPDLKKELRLIIEQRMPWEGAAFNARARKVLKQLNVKQILHHCNISSLHTIATMVK
jgi:hypothetical protein